MRAECQLQRGAHIRLRSGGQEWKLPAFVLHRGFHSRLRIKQKRPFCGHVAEMATFEKAPAYVLFAVAQLKIRSGREPVCSPGPPASSGAPHPTADEVSLIG